MKAVVCYSSRHHGDPLKVLKAMEPESGLELLDVTAQQPVAVALEDYDCIGLALGIYAFGFHRAVTEFARQKLPHGKPVFFVYTYGGFRGAGSKALAKIAREKIARSWGSFAAGGTTRSALFDWLAALQKVIRTPEIWKMPAAFSEILKSAMTVRGIGLTPMPLTQDDLPIRLPKACEGPCFPRFHSLRNSVIGEPQLSSKKSPMLCTCRWQRHKRGILFAPYSIVSIVTRPLPHSSASPEHLLQDPEFLRNLPVV